MKMTEIKVGQMWKGYTSGDKIIVVDTGLYQCNNAAPKSFVKYRYDVMNYPPDKVLKDGALKNGVPEDIFRSCFIFVCEPKEPIKKSSEQERYDQLLERYDQLLTDYNILRENYNRNTDELRKEITELEESNSRAAQARNEAITILGMMVLEARAKEHG